MSDSDRSERSKIELAVALSIAILIGGAIFWKASTQEADSQIEAQDRAADYANTASIEVTPACRLRKLTVTECADQAEYRARPDQRDEYDLAAQQTMAAWTRAMGIAGLIGMAVGIVGLGLIYRTYAATREAAENSAETLRSFIAKERGILVPIVAEKAIELPAMREGLSIIVENKGSAPATIESIRFSYFYGGDWPDTFDHVLDTKRMIPPGKRGQTPCLPWVQEPKLDEPKILAGIISYETLGGKKFTCNFAHTLKNVTPDEYGVGGWSIGSAILEGRPYDT